VLNTIGSQTDIAETILSQVNISNDYFGRSKNLFAAQKPHFAYYAFDNGFGIINPKSEIVYDHNQQKIIYANSTDSLQNNKWLNYGKAYLQTNFQDNIDYATKK
jgi:hypothetical protein